MATDAGSIDASTPDASAMCRSTVGTNGNSDCGIGPGSYCNADHVCVTCGCDAGICTTGGVCEPSSHACYGAPPLLA